MRNIWTILKKDLSLFFVSPIAYVVLTVFFFITGLVFYVIMVQVMQASIQEMMQSSQFGGSPPLHDWTQDVFRSLFGFLGTYIILFFLPMLTMGVFAEEKRRGTIELLMTSPLTQWQVILGKFFASLTFYLVMLLPTVLYGLLIYRYSDPRPMWGPILSGYLGIFLIGAVLISVGIFISSLTENQVIAAVVTYTVFIILWIIDFVVRGSGAIAEAVKYLSMLNHYEDFAKGVIDLKSVIFYLSMIILGLFLTSSSVESMRWRE